MVTTHPSRRSYHALQELRIEKLPSNRSHLYPAGPPFDELQRHHDHRVARNAEREDVSQHGGPVRRGFGVAGQLEALVLGVVLKGKGAADWGEKGTGSELSLNALGYRRPYCACAERLVVSSEIDGRGE
jgi:hypothetical protein